MAGLFHRAAALAAVLAAGALPGCAVVGSSSIIEQALLPGEVSSARQEVRCQTRLGSYTLPKTLMRIQVLKPAKDLRFHTIKIETSEPVPENRHTFCLDHLANAFADDTVRVFREKVAATATDAAKHDSTTTSEATPFLQLVASRAVDQSVEIARKLIRTAFILISGNPDFAGARAGIEDASDQTVVRDLSFDPFDQHEVAEINRSITPLGFCVVAGDYSYDVKAIDIDRYCADPLGAVARHPSAKATAVQRQRYLVPKPTTGIFYRPRAHYPVSIYAKADPGSRERWRLAHMDRYAFENLSPIVSVGVGRAAFATMRTGLVFDDGVLTDVCIARGSGAAAFVNIPLDVIYGVIALPSQTIKATIDGTTTRRNLLLAQQQLIEAQEAYINYLADTDNLAEPNIPGNNTAKPLVLGATGIAGAPDPANPSLTARPDLNGQTALLTADEGALASVCSELLAANQGSILGQSRNSGARF